MKEITMIEAIGEAIVEEMKKDKKIIVFGEDIGVQAVWPSTKKAWELFGGLDVKKARVMDTPISETAIVGAGVGAAVAGLRPVIELMFVDFAPVAGDEIVNQAAKMRYMFGGKAEVPLVIRMSTWAGQGAAAQHSQSLEAWFMHIPGLQVVLPSTPYDAKGLLKTSIASNDPVIFLEHNKLKNMKGMIPEEDYSIPLGKADIKKEGRDITIIATMAMVHKALTAAEELSTEGLSVEVIDPRTIMPLDEETILGSVKKTGKVVIVEEACRRGGFNAEMAAIITDKCFDFLDAPPVRIGGLNTPVPFSSVLEDYFIPSVADIKKGVMQSISRVS